MSNLEELPIIILRYLLENNHIASRGISPRNICASLGLSEDDYFSVDLFLLQSQFLGGGGGGPDGIRWLTPLGAQFIREELKNRIRISLMAERVVRLLVHDVTDDESLTMDVIIKKLSINPKEYLDVTLELEDLGFVKKESYISDEYPRLLPTKEGRLAFRKGFQAPVSAPLIQAGAIFNGPINGGNIQAFANAFGSNIEQNVSSLPPEELRREMDQTLEKLVAQISEQLSIQQRAAYTQLAAEFQNEIAQADPNSSKLHKLLGMLGFMADVGGTIDLGKKAFGLIAIASPYIMLLSQYVNQLLSHVAH